MEQILIPRYKTNQTDEQRFPDEAFQKSERGLYYADVAAMIQTGFTKYEFRKLAVATSAGF